MKTDQLGAAFERVIGRGAVQMLAASFTAMPVVLLAGDQASGKSTAAKLIAQRLGGVVGSTGALVRARAVESGLSFEEFNRRMADDPDADVRNDFRAAQMIAAGGVAVFEGRLAGHLGAWLRGLGRRSLYAVYLVCPPRERARRWLEREAPEFASIAASLHLGPDGEFRDVLAAIETTALATPARNRTTAVLAKLKHAGVRDVQDRERLRRLYAVDYADRSLFDAVVDTSASAPETTAGLILGAHTANTTTNRGGRPC